MRRFLLSGMCRNSPHLEMQVSSLAETLNLRWNYIPEDSTARWRFRRACGTCCPSWLFPVSPRYDWLSPSSYVHQQSLSWSRNTLLHTKPGGSSPCSQQHAYRLYTDPHIKAHIILPFTLKFPDRNWFTFPTCLSHCAVDCGVGR